MDALDCIGQRHSYRQGYTDEAVPRTDLEKILQAGLDAPSGCNKQTTQFVVVDDPQVLQKLRKVNNMPAVQTAPAMIFCLVDRHPMPAFSGRAFQIEDASAAVQNMLLAITALGYASVWVQGGLSVDGAAEAVAAILNVPPEKQVFILLPVGRPAGPLGGPEKMPAQQRVSYNQYGCKQ